MAGSAGRSQPSPALENWFGLFAPAGTPAPVVARLSAAVTQALKDPDLVRRLGELGGEARPQDPAAFKSFVGAESARFAKIVQDARITAE